MAGFKVKELHDLLVERHGFARSKRGGTFGTLAGLPVHVAEGGGEGNPVLFVIMGTASGEASGRARERLLEDGGPVAGGPFPDHQVEASDEALVLGVPRKGLRGRDAREVLEPLVAAARAAAEVPGAVPEQPRGSRLALVNGLPAFVDAGGLAAMQAAGEQAHRSYEETPARYGAALILGLLAMAGGALVWGLVGGLLRIQAWIIAIGLGFGVAVLSVRGAGRTSRPIQALVVALTLGGVVLGEVLALTIGIWNEAGVLAPVECARLYFDSLEEAGTDLAFALGGGVIGAIAGSGLASRPRFRPDVEFAGDEASGAPAR